MVLYKFNFTLVALPDETPEQAAERLHKVIKAGRMALREDGITSFVYGFEPPERYEYEPTKVVDFGAKR